ncbi:MAG: class I SAM-dependent methyltransferase [Methylovulum sp.]|uniref:class I SAM-dependent methyltransferase n=1 Tax=Methylovulum sp. TaxID=1916980 RepID=UPI00260EECEC|nr:class I SAM-dependent methyltransferase [Methylovulum sp.]MDD2723220.1 class I SAM-dependent methyltransferase [Methylovulum sp.]MDD5123161.1 class I SAM-dependent methyltransferase [Methylovulum sp.]
MATENVNPKRQPITTSFPLGHFYSPIVNNIELEARADEIWPRELPTLLGIDFNESQQLEFLQTDIAKVLKDFDYPSAQDGLPEDQFFLANGLFSGLDAVALFAMLRKLKPKRMIEVGSGFSSLLTADVNRRFLDGQLTFTCIEPFPRPFLKEKIAGLHQVIESKVEQIDLEFFDQLEGGDILFIDSSHVAKTGSDVNYLYFNILPRLKAGVFIHIHDIFFPRDYPREWVIKHNRSWNEQYVLRALLMFSSAFRVVFGCAYMHYVFPAQVKQRFDGQLLGGGSFWMQKTI